MGTDGLSKQGGHCRVPHESIIGISAKQKRDSLGIGMERSKKGAYRQAHDATVPIIGVTPPKEKSDFVTGSSFTT